MGIPTTYQPVRFEVPLQTHRQESLEINMTHVIDALGRIKEYWGPEVALADLADYSRGYLIRGGASDYEAFDAKTDGAALVGDGTDIVSTLTPTWKGLHTFDDGLLVGVRTRLWVGSWADPITPHAVNVSAGERINFYKSGAQNTAIGMEAFGGIWMQAHGAGSLLELWSGAAGAAPTQKVTVLIGGEVGIGTPTPAWQVVIAGSAGDMLFKWGAYIEFTRAGANVLYASDADGTFQLGAGGNTNDLVIQADHDVVIPNSNFGISVIPSTRFDIGAGAMEFEEMAAPAAGVANTGRLYCKDNGAGKTQLVAKFSDGAEHVLATMA